VAIVNEFDQDDHGALQLRFCCYIGLSGKQWGPKERAQQALFDGDLGYKAALHSTLKRTSGLPAEGRL
jgi:hypothetical protein